MEAVLVINMNASVFNAVMMLLLDMIWDLW